MRQRMRRTNRPLTSPVGRSKFRGVMGVAPNVCPWFLSGGGACGEVARSTDWATTPLGPTSTWSPSLKAMASLVLGSPHPMFLFWGPRLVQLYNDAFLPSFSPDKHPAAMGQRGAVCSPDAWSTVGPQLEAVLRDGKASRHDNRLVSRRREGRLEEVYWTYSYSPVFEVDGTVGGVLVVCNETTACVLAERRARTLRTLVARAADASSSSELLPIAVDVLRSAAWDMPFVAAYEIDGDGAPRLRATTSEDRVETLRLIGAALAERPRDGWGADPDVATIDLPPTVLAGVPWPEPVTRAFVAPVPASPTSRATELLVFGLSPRLRETPSYREYLSQVADAVGQVRVRLDATEARARAESERRDLLRQAPMPIVLTTGREHRIELANSAFVEVHGSDPTGRTVAEAFPELAGAELTRALDRVYTTGAPFKTNEQRVASRVNGALVDRWFKLSVQPLRDADGLVYGLLGVADEITEAVAARRTLERCSGEREKLLDAVEKASRAKDNFLAILGHELRNPLAPITTALHLMKLKEPGALVREREIIARQTGHLVRLVDDLLDVARVARGKVTLNRTRIALADVIARAVETANPLFEQRRQTLTVDVPSQDLDVEADPIRLAQVFANLLTNAAKYTDPGGAIAVRAERRGDLVVARVEDNGIGIEPDHLPRVFDAFFQAPRPSDRVPAGLGLGLALVKSFVTLHGGTVAATSRPGGGSVFEVKLPALASAVEPRAAERPPAPAASDDGSRRTRVLLVDDSDDILELVATFLRYAGYEVMTTRDAPSALRLAATFHPNVAVLDIGLPAMDGYDLAEHLREELGDEAPRMIAMTGYGQEADRERARRAGFAAHLVKPVDPQELLASVRATASAAASL
ncbi:MAG: response regulator [Labilithrix sp.]|nr:response regulator [Labilithrix sp.]